MTPRTMKGASAKGGLRRVGVIGDVHTEDTLLAFAIDHFKTANVDAMLCVGDITDGPNRESKVDRCCALLQREGVLTVCGNHDRWTADEEQRDVPGATHRDDLAEETLAFLNSLPPSIAFDTVAGRALLCHGLEHHDMASVKPFDRGAAIDDNEALQAMLSPRVYDFVINGHTHHRMVRTIDGLTVINAGTLHREHTPGFLIVDFEARVVEFFDVKLDGSIGLAETLPLRDTLDAQR